MGRASSLGTLKDMLRKSLDAGISLRRGPFITEGNLLSGGGRLVKRGWTKEGTRNGASLREGLREGDLEGGLLYWGTQRYVK